MQFTIEDMQLIKDALKREAHMHSSFSDGRPRYEHCNVLIARIDKLPVTVLVNRSAAMAVTAGDDEDQEYKLHPSPKPSRRL